MNTKNEQFTRQLKLHKQWEMMQSANKGSASYILLNKASPGKKKKSESKRVTKKSKHFTPTCLKNMKSVL